ncbi:hypothetical protein Afil01_17610 [Actinorhabdospora filicis]|uniref:YCII-related domain-containing protein n=1 Tax=Actinorhabdospora filicis TaxID=1785913 RepID=A0A9W6W7V7_9ACTN|nr:YciI family protein [Actinorhabdospora filicis]GLZ76954.1 hypothetical protein Afil01_17610 [Actinorhabdospora filicis]
MKYLLMAYTSVTGWDEMDPSSPEFLEICAFYAALGEELSATGELVLTEGLDHPALTRTVRRVDGRAAVVDGPYAESKEVAASFAILDVSGVERALEIAARITEATGDDIEVRPIGSGPE